LDLSAIHEIHGSQLKSFRGCRLQWQWQYVEGYAPIVRPAPLEFGTAFHVAMETLYNPSTWHLPLIELYGLAKIAFTDMCELQQREYLDRLEKYQLEPDEEVDYQQRVDMGLGMLRKVARTMDRRNFHPIAVEKECFAPILNPVTGEPLVCPDCGKPFYYGLRPDAVLQDRDGCFWLVDWKTAAMLLKDQMILELDGQIATYLWALAYMWGLNFAGFLYVQIYKGFPKRPRVLEYSRLGRKFSVSHQQRTDAPTFTRVVKKYDLPAYEAGLYDEYIAWLQECGPEFIKWFKVYKSPTQLATVGRDLATQVMEMSNDVPIYPNPGRMICQRCAFQEPCLERQSGGDYRDILNSSYEQLEPYYVRQRILREEHDV
jgi:hypothetical protein